MKKEESKSRSKILVILMIICVVLSIITLGIVVYDKFIRSDDLEHPLLKPISGSKEDANNKCDNDITYVEELKDIAITDVNQSVKLGNREFKVKTGSQDNQDYVLFINDKSVSKDNKFIYADKAYVTDKYVLFTSTIAYSFEQKISYAIDIEGKEINVKGVNLSSFGGFVLQEIDTIDGILHASIRSIQDPNQCASKIEFGDIMFLYIGNTLFITLVDYR